MKHVYLFESRSCSFQCGVGTYLNELFKLSTRWEEIKLCVIVFQTQVEACTPCTCNGIDYILLPRSLKGNPSECDRSLLEHLEPFIEYHENCIFMYNYIPCAKLIRSVKDYFPLAKHVCVIHEFTWSTPLLGDSRKFSKMVRGTNSTKPSGQKISAAFAQEKEQFQLVDKIICLSPDAKAVLQTVYQVPVDKLAVIPNALSKKPKLLSASRRLALRRKYGLTDTEKVILSVGRISKGKGSLAFLQAFKEILKEEPDCRWVIVGGLAQAPAFLEQAGTAVTHLTLTGHVASKQLADWYRMADVGILPSYTEQCSYAGLEMMAYGLPVVASDGFGVRCMFRDGVNACVASIGKRTATKQFARNLAACVLRVWDNEEEKKRLRRNGFRILRERYTPAEVAKKYQAVFDSL